MLYGRSNDRKEDINELGANYLEVSDLMLRGVNVVLSLGLIVLTAQRPVGAFLCLLISSKTIVVMAWVCFMGRLFRRQDDGVSLTYAMLHKTYIGSEASSLDSNLYRLITVLAVLDIGLLKLLPWSRTKATKLLGGFPDAFTLRCVLYGSTLASLVQAVASIVGVAQGTSSSGLAPSAAIVFAIFSIFNTLRGFISTAMFLLSADLEEADVALVSASDAKRLESIEFGVELEDIITGDLKKDEKSDLKKDIPTLSGADEDKSVVLTPFDAEKAPVAAADVVDDYLDDTKEDTGFKVHTTKERFADETLAIRTDQLKEKGIMPAEYIPLPELKAEMQRIMNLMERNQPFDEARWDFLSLCLQRNPEFRAEQEELARRWRAGVQRA